MEKIENLRPLGPTVEKLNLSDLLTVCQRYEREGDEHGALLLLRTWLRSNANARSSHAAWYELGRMLQNMHQYGRAESSFRSALEQRPSFTEAGIALGKSLESQGKKSEAIDTWLSFLPTERTQIALLNNIARVQDETHDLLKIESTLIRSLKLDPNQGDVLTTLLHARQKLCRWPVISTDLPSAIRLQRESIGPLMSLALFDDPVSSLDAAVSFIKAKNLQEQRLPAYSNASRNKRKLHIGFLSADIRLHATSVFFMPLLEHYDRKQFKVSILDITTAQETFSDFRGKLIGFADQHVPLQGLTDEEAVQKCRQLDLDVLVDLGGLTAGARPRIVAERVAPVQVSYIGFLSSTAIPNMDYVITTEDLFPNIPGAFSEKPLKLNCPYLVMDLEPEVVGSIKKESLGISDDIFLFGALLNSYKINQEVFNAWMKILKIADNSVIWLVEDNEISKNNLIQEAKALGVEKERLIFSRRVHPAIYRRQLKICDLFLDAFPYGSGATARDAIHANLPILTKPGNTMMSRLSSHMMSQVGITDLITTSVEEYINRAIAMTKNPAELAALKVKLKDKKYASKLYNQKEFVSEFYSVIRKVYLR